MRRKKGHNTHLESRVAVSDELGGLLTVLVKVEHGGLGGVLAVERSGQR